MTTLITPTPQVRRDWLDRPYIKQPDGKEVTYTRTTTFVGAFEDTWNIEKWKMRMTAIGLSLRKDLLLAVAAHKGEKDRLNKICDQAVEAAEASAAATTGTALHTLCEQVDRGQEVHGLPDSAIADLAAYTEATKDLKAIHIEQMMVHDAWKVAGTPDRVVEYQGKRYIADIKTGDIEYGAGKIAAQLAMYARSKVYDIATGERSNHGADIERGIVIHLPAGSGTCELKWIDLKQGWATCVTCNHVRLRRKIKAKDLYEPFGVDLMHTVAESIQANLERQIAAAATTEELRTLWQANATLWTPQLTEMSKARIEALESTRNEGVTA